MSEDFELAAGTRIVRLTRDFLLKIRLGLYRVKVSLSYCDLEVFFLVKFQLPSLGAVATRAGDATLADDVLGVCVSMLVAPSIDRSGDDWKLAG